MNTTIRKGNPKDIGVIAGFQRAMALETENITLNPEVLSNGIKAVFDDPSKGQYFVTEINKKVIASLMITYEWSDWRNSTVWWLQSVYVLPEFRRSGIFRKMYLFIKAEVESNSGVSGLRLYLVTSNHKAASTYEAVGMDGNRYRMFEWMKDY